MKTCGRCKQEKPLDAFAPRGPRGRRPWCRECNKEYSRNRRQQNLVQARREGRESEMRRRQADPTYTLNADLRGHYRMTLAQYIAKLAAQGGVCVVCGVPPGSARLGVDHDRACCPGDRSCGKCIRDLLCSGCNGGTGIVDNPVLLRKKAAYLLEWRERHGRSTRAR